MKIKNGIANCISYYLKFSDRLTENHVFAYASQASFFVIISAVPFLMIILNILRAVMPVTQDYFDNIITNFLPVQVQQLATDIVSEFYQKINLSVVSITSIFLIWTASRGVKAISYGLRMAFDTNDNTGYIKMSFWSLIYTVLFMVSIILTVGALLFGRYLANLLSKYIPPIKTIMDIILDLRYVVLLVFLTLVFMSAYKFLGKTKIKFRKLFPGAVLSAAFWLVFSFGYSIYISNMSRFSYIYGSLTAVIFLMLWLWFCMISLLLGAEVNRWLYENKLSFFGLLKVIFCGFTTKS